MVEDASIMVYQQVAKQEEMKYVSTWINWKLPNYRSYLYQWLNQFGFLLAWRMFMIW
jgi:tRNA(Ile)-lysidine synthase